MRTHPVVWIVAALVLGQTVITTGFGLGAALDQAPAGLCHPRDGLGNVLAKLEAGKEVRIAYFGGSITAADGWRPKTLAWFRQQFPKARIQEINATIGGTGSDLGVFRYQQDVLRHKPDLVFVEFSVNDGGTSPEAIGQAMEGIVRQTWRADPAIDLCFVYTFVVGYEKDLDAGLCPPAPSAHERIAQHYGIPSINVAFRVAELAHQGKLVFKADKDDKSSQLAGKLIFSNDGVHPLDAGHELYLQVVSKAIPEIQKQSKPGSHELKAPLRPDNWEAAKLVPLTEKMLHGSWRKLDPQQGLGKTFGNRLPVIWEGSTPGDMIQFRFKGTLAGLYDLMGPDGGQVVWTVDDKPGGPRPRFDRYCTYHRLASLKLAEGLADKEHTATVEVLPQQPDRSSVLDQVRNQPGFDPKKYEGTGLGRLPDDDRRPVALTGGKELQEGVPACSRTCS
jgi:lysophospholipase L1-like esterase